VRSGEPRPSGLPRRRTLTDGLVTLRAPRAADVDAYARSATDPDIIEFTHVPLNFGREGAMGFVATTDTEWESGQKARFAISLAKSPARLAGSISLVHLDWEARTGEIGYWVLPEVRGRGLAKRSVHLVTRWAFGVVGLVEIRANVFDGNDASWQVLMANGFRQVGHEVVAHRGRQRGQRLVALSALQG
jgi:RimJ/RimL family protein N-acetyltransferase